LPESLETINCQAKVGEVSKIYKKLESWGGFGNKKYSIDVQA